MKWYHEWQQNARKRYLDGYYPRHERMPNFIVRVLYWIGYFFGDFVPLIMNLIDSIYMTIRRLFAFIASLLIEASTVIVLIGTIAFSISHSIELLRRAGATGGMEYIGILMFEVVFIASTATLTGTLMKKKKPRGFFSIMGLAFSIAGFIMGLLFVWWSNVTGMAPTRTGQIIGFSTPILLIIAEGILAYRYLNESAEEDESQVIEIIQRNRLTVEDVRHAIQLYLNQKTNSQTGPIGQLESDSPTEQNESDTQIGQQELDNQTIIGQPASDTFGQSDNEESDNQTESIGHPDTKTGQSDKDESDSPTEQVRQSDTPNGQSESDSKTLLNLGNSPTDETIGQSDTHGQTENQTLSDNPIEQESDKQKSDSKEIGHQPSDTFGQSDNPIKQTKSDSNRTTRQSNKKTDTSRAEKKSDKVVQFKKKKPNRQARELSDEEIKKMAEEFKSENGKLPSIRQLAALASCSKYKAEKAINELREAQ
jgi:hypothetical protein